MRNIILRARRAVTLTELLVVLVIISLLATLAVPVFVQKVQQARVAIARSETRSIADAVQAVAITHGFVVPLQVLDNVPDQSATATDADDFRAGVYSSVRVIDAFVPVANQTGVQGTLGGTTNAKISKMVTNWQGPFINYKRVYNQNANSNNPGSLSREDLARDYPLDPWGRPYVLHSPIGVVGTYVHPTSASGNIDPTTYPDSVGDGILTTTEGGRFFTFAVVSLGPNGYSDGVTSSLSGTAPEDDIFYEFSPTVENETAYSNF